MKKIFYILASAIVALGAVACDNQDLDNIAPGVGGDSLSFSAVIDNTKTDLSGNTTVWVKDDVVVFEGYEEYEFVYDGSANFTCTVEGVTAALGDKDGLTAWYNKAGIDSTKGTAGAQLKAEGCSFTALNPSFKFAVQNAFLKFTAAEDAVVTIAGDNNLLSAASVEITGTGAVQYVAINPKNATLSYSIGGVQCKEVNLTFAAKNIYNLGFLGGMVSLSPGVWDVDGAWFAARFYNDTQAAAVNALTRAGEEVDEAWVKMTDNNYDGVYECLVPGAYTNVIFCRMASTATEANFGTWDDVVWNKSADLTIDNECYAVTDWNAGEWGEKPAAPTYAVAGDFNTWGDNAMEAVSGVENLYVAKGIKMEAYKAFKIKITGSWDTSWGASISYVKQNKFIAAIKGGGDITIEKAGTYDVYFDRANLKIYLMTSGTNYTAATEQTTNGEAPETGNKYYFKPNSNWAQAGAKFSGYFWNASGNKWAELTDEDKDGTYECNLGEWVPTNVIFLRKDPTGFVYNNWTCWNRIGNITVPTGKNFYTMASGVWTQQIESGSGYTGGTWGTK